MKLDEYQKKAKLTAHLESVPVDPLVFLALGLTGESGEVAEKIKKILRNDGGKMSKKAREGIKLELGDVLWYVSQLADILGYKLDDIAVTNLKKLTSRDKRGVLSGEGDNR